MKSVPPHDTSPTVCPASNEAGFSVIEGLIAALMLLVITLGILPLFSRAMANNVKGNDSSRQANAVIGAFETSGKVPYNSDIMTVPSGSTSLVVTDFLALKKIASPTGGIDQALSTRWELAADLGSYDEPVMSRQRTVQYFSLDDLDDNQTFDNPLDGSVEPRLVHFKVVDVAVQDLTGTGTRPYLMRSIQAY